MKRSYINTLPAAVLTAVVLSASPMLAQDRQLQDSVSEGLATLGIMVEQPEMLSQDQLLQIDSVLTSGDPEDEKTSRIERILASDTGPKTGLGVAQLEDSVAAEMARLGLDTEGLPALSVEQLAEIEGVVGTSEPDDTKRMRIERIIAGR